MNFSSNAAGADQTISSRRRLLFVMNTPLVGGAERHTFELAAALRPYGWKATIFAMKPGPLPPPPGIALLQPARPAGLLPRVRQLAGALAEERPDLIVAVNERPVLAATAARHLAGGRIPIVAISHSTVLRNRKEEWMQRVYTPLFNRIDGVVFISRNQRTFWQARGLRPRNDTTILNGIDLERYAPALRQAHRDTTRARYGFAATDFVIGLCAVMRPEKNHLQIVEAVARLRARGVPARALLVGDGPMREAVMQRAAALDLADHIVIAGMHADVRPFVAAFDVGVLCSISIETLSLAALETMAMAIPMVMSDLGGASEIVDADCGKLFPVGDLDGLCAALEAFAPEKARLEAGAAARAKVEAVFGYRKMVAGYSEYFSTLLAQAPSKTVV